MFKLIEVKNVFAFVHEVINYEDITPSRRTLAKLSHRKLSLLLLLQRKRSIWQKFGT